MDRIIQMPKHTHSQELKIPKGADGLVNDPRSALKKDERDLLSRDAAVLNGMLIKSGSRI